eukprot:11025115-Alexandrium_andersonii.AAC.1
MGTAPGTARRERARARDPRDSREPRERVSRDARAREAFRTWTRRQQELDRTVRKGTWEASGS